MAFFFDAAGWSDGIYQLSDAVIYVQLVFSGLWLWEDWKYGQKRNLSVCVLHLDITNNMESYLDALFQVWSAGMVLAQPYVLEAAVDEESDIVV